MRSATVSLAVGMLAALVGPVPAAATDLQRVIVQAGSAVAAATAVERAGGEVTVRLPIVDGVAATVPNAALSVLRATLGVRAVTPDSRMHPQGTVVEDAGPRSVYRKSLRIPKLASRGGTGEGVTVALIDTGISATPDLVGRVKPVNDRPCLNLSGSEGCDDEYGHGTFMAGLIAGDGAASDGKYQGAAPEAHLVSIKVAGRDGSTDVSNVLSAIQWVVTYQDRYGIRVLNLSFGTDSTQSWRTDPLNYAVERAWRDGIAVIVAASNRGPDEGTIAKPGDDPWVITVGATDDVETARISDDVLPDFSSRGPTAEGIAKPDVVAPGGRVVSLRAHGSAIDDEFPHYVDDTYRRGSGTSMSTAIVSGVAAAVLSVRPDFEPDRLKYALMETARPVAEAPENAVGRGIVHAAAAAFRAPDGVANEGLGKSDGWGKLELSRGDVRVSIGGELLDGELTSQGVWWDLFVLLEFLGPWTERVWYLLWQINDWGGMVWAGHNWEGHNWEGCSRGETHDDECWYGHNWEGSAWYGVWDGIRTHSD